MNLPALAKQAVENHLNGKKFLDLPGDLPKEILKERAGVFVTIEKTGDLRQPPLGLGEPELRGCVGTYLPTRKNIAEEIVYNAISAATEDYRFGLIEKKELPYLRYTVYILGKPQPIKNMAELDAKKYGVIVKAAGKSGLLLPALEGVDTVEQQILIACDKAGIRPAQEKLTIYKFTVRKYE